MINLVFGPGAEIGDAALASPELAGVHFTGSTAVFHSIWRRSARTSSRYRNYPRIVGETGGKDFILAHPSADPDAVATAIVRGSFEYQGQKCSASSRLYIPSNLWPRGARALADEVGDDPDGRRQRLHELHGRRDRRDVVRDAARGDRRGPGGRSRDRRRRRHRRQRGLVRRADRDRDRRPRRSGSCATSCSGRSSPRTSTTRAVGRHARARRRDGAYALTGAVFSDDRYAIDEAHDALRYAAGNFYVNDKPTGAVVGQQPFGGARASGTNDKAGSMWNLIRWVSPRTIKETLVPPTDYRYPFLAAGRLISGPTRDRQRRERPRGHRASRRLRSAIATVSFWDYARVRSLPLPLALAIGCHVAQARVHEPRLAQRPRRRLPGRARPLALDLRRLRRRRRRQRDLPGARRRRRPARSSPTASIPGSTYTTVVARRSCSRSSTTSCALALFAWALHPGRPAGPRRPPIAPDLRLRLAPRGTSWSSSSRSPSSVARSSISSSGSAPRPELRRPRRAGIHGRPPARPATLRTVVVWQLADWALRLATIWFLLGAFGIEQTPPQRAARPGDAEPRDPRAGQPRRDRHRAGIPRLRPPRAGIALDAARVQRRDEAHAHASSTSSSGSPRSCSRSARSASAARRTTPSRRSRRTTSQ